MGSGRRGTAHQQAQGGAVPDPVILEFRHRPLDGEPDSLADSSEEEHVTSAELARRLNASIYKVGQLLGDRADEEVELTFFCACGCMTEVKRSLQDYVIRGAVVNGHPRPAGHGPSPDPHDE
jgi:hypothetical protein